MTGSTSRYSIGYPQGTDPVRNGDDTVAAALQKIDLLMGEWGTVTVTGIAVDTVKSQRINYSRSYAGVPTPRAFAMQDQNTVSGTNTNIWITGEDSTGFWLNFRSASSADRTFRWFAKPF